MSRQLLVTLCVASLVTAAGCKGGGGSSDPANTKLGFSVSPSSVKPDGSPIHIRVSAFSGSSWLDGDVTVQVSCGQVLGTDGTVGVTRALRNGSANFFYSCDPAVQACCTDGTEVKITASYGDITKTGSLMLDKDAIGTVPGGDGTGGGSAGGGGSGGGGSWASGITLDPDEVALWGTLSEGACWLDAVAHLDRPAAPLVGFGCYDDYAVIAGGAVTFTAGPTPDVLRRMHPDNFTLESGRWTYPATPFDNDVVVPTPKCTTGAPDFGVMYFVMRPGSSEVIYHCSSGWWDESEKLVLEKGTIHAWNASDLLLVTDENGKLAVMTKAGTSTPVTGLTVRPLHARAHGDGFLALADAGSEAYERWSITAAGVATRDGTFAGCPSKLTCYRQAGKLDGKGDLYAMGEGPEVFEDVVVRFPLQPDTAEVVYDEAKLPENPTHGVVKIHISSLITGP